jgi:hypothetical protein
MRLSDEEVHLQSCEEALCCGSRIYGSAWRSLGRSLELGICIYIYRYINTLIFTPLPSHRQFFPNLPGKAIPLLGLK